MRPEVVAIIIAAAVLVLLAALVFLRHTRNNPAAPTTEFIFSTPRDTHRQQFIYQVAGLIKAATGLDTHLVALGKYEFLDIEVHRGMRCVGVVSVVPPAGEQQISERIHAIARAKTDKHARTAYLVSGRLFKDADRRYAQRAGVILLDGAALTRIQNKAAQGLYAKRQEEPPPLTPAEAKRWRPKQAAPVHPAAVVDPLLEPTQERKFPKPPWVEFR